MSFPILTIAGSDCSGGAGIQADLKTFSAHRLYGMSVITALTSQNTIGVQKIFDVSADFVGSQIDSIFDDIFPNSIKIGMVLNSDIIRVIVSKLKEHKAKNIVVDPVMVSTSGDMLLSNESLDILVNELLKMADVITPNIYEAEILSKIEIRCKKDMITAAKKISKFTNATILLKGGHLVNDCSDLIYKNNEVVWLEGPLHENENTHGTGCTLSSAIASNLANGMDVETSCRRAKKYVNYLISKKFDIGKGRGPLLHMDCNEIK